MAVEIYKSDFSGGVYGDLVDEIWAMGWFFSNGTHFTIIDSYSSHYWNNYPVVTPKTYGPHRYKGNPFTDDDPSRSGLKHWDDVDDMGEANDWLVIQCETTMWPLLNLPKWQLKLQWVTTSPTFADVSDTTGETYPKNHGSNRQVYWRFAPWGGWDLADTTPDFHPMNYSPDRPSTGNQESYIGHGGSGNPTRFYVVCDDGWLMRFHRYDAAGAYRMLGFGGHVGDVSPIVAGGMVMPRAFLGTKYTIFNIYGRGSTGQVICDDAYHSSGMDAQEPAYRYNINGSGSGISFWDNDLNLIEEHYRLPSRYTLMQGGRAQPYMGGAVPRIELFPYIPMPYHAHSQRFSIPSVRYGYGVGMAQFVGSGQWVSTCLGSMTQQGDFCAYLKWDGSTPLF